VEAAFNTFTDSADFALEGAAQNAPQCKAGSPCAFAQLFSLKNCTVQPSVGELSATKRENSGA
jgi:hypothetical protein